MAQDPSQTVSSELTERLCQVVNDVLAMFNEKHVTPSEAGTVILALIHRLMGVLQDNPEQQRAFVTSVIGVVNEHLLQSLEGGETPPCCS